MQEEIKRESSSIGIKLGKFIGYTSPFVVPFLGLLVIHSASQTNLYILATSIIIVGFAITTFAYDVRRAKNINDIYGEYEMLMLYYGITQLILWIIDHQNSIHEPRTVFLLGLAGIIKYLMTRDRDNE